MNDNTQHVIEKVRGLHCMTDLHLHLDGAITPNNARKLAAAQGISIPQDEAELRNKLQVSDDCKDLNKFLEKFDFPNTLMQTKLGITMAVQNLLTELVEMGLMYAEMRFAPQLSTLQGLSQKEVLEASIEGIQNSPIKTSFILCAMRGDDTHEANLETFRLAAEYLGHGVCAVDLAGAEAIWPTTEFKAEFDLARELGLPYTIHGGEAAGPESVRTALEYGATRIGHGVRSIEDPNLVQHLAEIKMPLEVCPTSNINTCIFPDMQHHAIRQLIEAGCMCAICTDNLSVENTNIKQEFYKIIEAHDFTEDEVKQFLLNSVEAAFTDDVTKAGLKAKIEAEF